ncbi:MAG: rhomboid family intramembrane serine protease [Paracoccaceae bacterium]|nr:rhomboid family intramembrane serine protease [Paracoccaceae bacterium]
MTDGDDSRLDETPPAQGRGWIVGLIAAMAVIEAATGFLGLMSDRPWGVRGLLVEYGAFWPGLLDNWQPNYAAQPVTMFVTYGFIHGGVVHFAVNMLTLWSLGARVMDRAGPGVFAAVYGAALLGGAAAFWLFAPDLRPMVGASGALFGLAGAVLAWEYLDRAFGALSLWPVGQAILLLVGLNLVLWWAMDGLLAWQAHLGGFLAGWAAAVVLDPARRDR